MTSVIKMVDALPLEDEPPAERPTRGILAWLVTLLPVAVVAVLFPTFVAQVYTIPTGSMEPTLHGCPGCENDRVLVDKLVYRFREPAQGEVVVFELPRNWLNHELPPRSGETDLIKRVIAVAGQTVSCCDPRNRLLVDGKPLDEPYIGFSLEHGPAAQPPFPPVQVPPGQLWVMGDNRNASIDSRAPDNGPVPVSDVIGKARMIVLPTARFGRDLSPGGA